MPKIRSLTEGERRITAKWLERLRLAEVQAEAAKAQLAMVRDALNDLPTAFGHDGAKIDPSDWTLTDG